LDRPTIKNVGLVIEEVFSVVSNKKMPRRINDKIDNSTKKNRLLARIAAFATEIAIKRNKK
jgi:hypothetical protein